MTADDLDNLETRFRSCTLPKTEWTHEAHLAVGMWHVFEGGPAKALRQLRARIRRLNDAHGTANTTTSGYHETVTRAYVALLADFLSHRPANEALVDTVQALWRSPLAGREVLLAYYSRERLMSVEARLSWLEPDRRPLPAAPSPQT
jgi:hypothetical protein